MGGDPHSVNDRETPMSTPTYQLHHLCIYEKSPRNAMWNWLRWNHAIPAYYWEGSADMHHTGEGGVDYTFLACGAPFQMQLETGPYQFEYERKWFAEHDSGINHVCWIVPNAWDTIEPLTAIGAVGIESGTPILPLGTSTIIAIGASRSSVQLRDGNPVEVPLMTVCATFDHRIIDGGDAGRFLTQLKQHLEVPALGLL
ncbi:2-oxo acid dehydrogenase subunit E2 [Acidimicrobiales bacterium]|nr:2-oxo acid dehydrogenase subunit E2 [Acidimicrobiales bacterium]